ncbi:TonB-dependent receptor [Sphingorhabdus contaminans]|uniref:TonB-dependent receptor n=1 Tax=Sphingorhabdus contaminans TaxID=1343899 RepID=UPI003D2B48AA
MKKFVLLVGTALSAIASPAFAQDVEDDADGSEIIVTATLREASVQDIPVAVTAVAPETLERQGIVDIKTLSAISPSINVQSSQTETQGTSIKIRGVGTTGNNTGLESSVGVFIDGVYQSRPGVALGDLVDLERLEVLRGPQGTLFGRNTSAGALNITTRRPSLSEFEGFANASYGNYNFMNVQAGVSAPIAQDVAAVRLSGTWRKRDGYLKSSTGAESNNRDRYMLRGQLYVEPSSDVSIRLLADYSKVDENCCDAAILLETPLAATFPFHGLASNGVTNSGFSALQDLRTNSQLFRNGSTQWGVSGELKWELGAAKLTSITAYRDFSSFSRQESDFVGLNIFSVGTGGSTTTPNFPRNGDEIKTFTQELRLQGTAFDDKLDWLVGGFYGREKIQSQGAMMLGADFQRAVSAGNFGTAAGVNPLFALTALGNGGVPVDANGANAINRFDQDGETFSIFTHNVFSLSDKFSITLGARYVDEKKDASYDQLSASNAACQASVNGVLTAAVPAALRAGLIGLNCFSFVAPVNLTAPLPGSPLASNFLPLPREWANRFKDDELTYTAQLTFKPNEDLMLYGSFSHGFKSGGFNLDQTAANLINSTAVLTTGAAPVFADPRFDSEKVDAYELGAKATMGRVNVNLALFQMDMSDFQVLEFTGVQFTTFNVASARSRGFEIEAFGKLHDYISMNASVTHAKAKYGQNCADGISAANLPSVSLLCGQTLTNAPEWSGVAGLTYDGPLNGSGWGLLANVNINYSGARRTSTQAMERRVNAATGATDFIGLPFDIQEDYFKINARLGFTDPSERFTFEIWGTNLSNEITRGITSNTPLRGAAGAVGGPSARSRIAFVEEPRMYGITVRTKF